MAIAIRYVDSEGRPFVLGGVVTCQCARLDMNVMFPITDAVDHAIANVRPVKIHFQFIPKPQRNVFSLWAAGLTKPPSFNRQTSGFANIATGILSPNFVAFYEEYRQWLFDMFGLPDHWPTVWRFARVIRNAISHGGRVRIDRAKDLPVHWHGVMYTQASSGTLAFGPGGDLEFADMIVLMFEMSDELDRLGCPF